MCKALSQTSLFHHHLLRGVDTEVIHDAFHLARVAHEDEAIIMLSLGMTLIRKAPCTSTGCTRENVDT